MVLGLSTLGPRQLYVSSADTIIVFTVMATLLALQTLLRNTTLEEMAQKIPAALKVIVIALMLVAIVMSPGEDRAFIYFQF